MGVTGVTRDAAARTMTLTTTFPSDAAMEQLVLMGFAEGLSAAVGQADALLAAWDAG